MKRLFRTVKLRFFQDENTGDWGVTHKATCKNEGGFNAFWTGRGIFHDVFEHSQEYEHPYFQGEAAMNQGGEMFAMGAMVYYIAKFHIDRNPGSFRSTQELAVGTTLSAITDIAYQGDDGYSEFGEELISHVPYQPPVLDYLLEDTLYGYEHDLKQAKEKYPGSPYLKTVTMRKVRDLHRAGYRWAARSVPHDRLCDHNRNMLEHFIKFWTDYCKQNKAEELAGYWQELHFKLYKDKGRVSWTAVLVPDRCSGENCEYIRDGQRKFGTLDLKN